MGGCSLLGYSSKLERIRLKGDLGSWRIRNLEEIFAAIICPAPSLPSLYLSDGLVFGEWVAWAPVGAVGSSRLNQVRGMSEVTYLDLALWRLDIRTNFSQCPMLVLFKFISIWDPLWLGKYPMGLYLSSSFLLMENKLTGMNKENGIALAQTLMSTFTLS